MSNTATTALMLALIAPALAQIPPDDPFRKALLLPVPVSANVAGMSTPIASPPNAIAVSYLARESAAIGCQVWMAAAVPIVIVLLLVTWWRLRRLFPATGVRWRIEFPDTTITRRGVLVMIIAIVTFACWVTEPWHGVSASAVSVLPVTLLFATGIISREDVNSLDWDVLIRADRRTRRFAQHGVAGEYAANAMTYARGGLSSADFLRTAGFIGTAGAILVIAVLVFLR